MYEKILQKLKDQRGTTSTVSDRSLEDMAKSLSTVITTDDQLTAADFTDAIKSIDGNINNYTSEAVKTALQKKSDEEAARKKKELEEKAKKDKDANKNDEEPEWAKTLRLQNEELRAKYEASEKSKAVETRKAQVQSMLKDMPEYLKTPILQGFDNLNFESDEKFTEYLGTVKASTESFQQAAKESGLNITLPGKDVKKVEPNGETDILKEARELVEKTNAEAAKAAK